MQRLQVERGKPAWTILIGLEREQGEVAFHARAFGHEDDAGRRASGVEDGDLESLDVQPQHHRIELPPLRRRLYGSEDEYAIRPGKDARREQRRENLARVNENFECAVVLFDKDIRIGPDISFFFMKPVDEVLDPSSDVQPPPVRQLDWSPLPRARRSRPWRIRSARA
ncbi:hypothetical protein M2322_004609 [Rhodoblastus acidophilus]|uniref:hypothetical protein n=1 Tax=Rhodoblastus acidophilus TaxID=1074 RepID=UPI0022257A0C|nr:hypothetical protein [Rhodoblastus acidophilus]MCW2319040.1 hypothetical protein [Rhodoblastus acidophilus]